VELAEWERDGRERRERDRKLGALNALTPCISACLVIAVAHGCGGSSPFSPRVSVFHAEVVVRRPADELHHPQPAFHPLDLGPEALGGLHVLFDGGHLGVGQRAVLRLGLLGQRQRLLAEAVVLLLQLVQLFHGTRTAGRSAWSARPLLPGLEGCNGGIRKIVVRSKLDMGAELDFAEGTSSGENLCPRLSRGVGVDV